MGINDSKVPETRVRPNASRPPNGWPGALGSAALQGLVGDIVNTISPHCEADVAALVLGTLSACGNVVGPKPHFSVNQTRHSLNLYTVFVGDSARARKGTSWDIITALFGRVDPEWAEKSLQCGLSSGEGVIAVAAGCADRRLLFQEDEFAAVLKVMGRLRSTLSTTLRRAWDNRTLQVLTKANPVVVKGAHISLVGQITIEDLMRHFDVTELRNGMANRILWTCIKRRQLLPFGGSVPDADFREIAMRLKSAVKFAQRCGEIGFSEKAAKQWAAEYERLGNSATGLVGATTSRAEAQTRRMATVYAVMDECGQVRLEHLRAALEVWDYCEASAHFIFGDRRRLLTTRGMILQMLQGSKEGRTRSEISKRFSNHLSTEELSAALEELRKDGFAESRRFATGGRTAERWFALGEGRRR